MDDRIRFLIDRHRTHARRAADTNQQDGIRDPETIDTIFAEYGKTPQGRRKLAASVINVLRLRLEARVQDFREMNGGYQILQAPEQYTTLLARVDDLIAEGNAFYALAYTKNEEADVDFRKLKAMNDKIAAFRSEVAARVGSPKPG